MKDCDDMMEIYKHIYTQYAHDVVLTSVRRRFDVTDVVWTSKRCRVLTGICHDPAKIRNKLVMRTRPNRKQGFQIIPNFVKDG